MTSVDLIETTSPAPDSGGALVSMIERLAIDPRVDVDKLDRLLQMQERIMDRNAKAAYARALAEMQPHLPTIERGGKIVVYSKADREFALKNDGQYPANARPQQLTSYARIEDITEAIRGPMAAHGFSFSSRIDTLPDNRILVKGILSHRDGHSEETSFPLPHDSSGSKNNVQAIGSSITYGRRYTLLALLNIVSHAPQDADDDAKDAGAAETIGADEVAYVEQQLRDTASDTAIFLQTLKAESVATLTAPQYKRALELIAAKKRKLAASK